MSFVTSLKGLREILTFDNSLELICHHLFKSDEQICTYRFSGYQVVMLKSGGDLNGMRACVATDQYKQFFRKMTLNEPLKVLDLGAHTGGFIFALLNEGYSISRSLSVEQNRQTHSRLAFNIALNNLQGSCQGIHAAVWSKTAGLVSSDGVGRTNGRVNLAQTNSNDESRMIQGHSVNQLIQMVDAEGIIDICKIDVEGAEWEIFAQLENCNLLFERCRYLVIEIHPTSEPTVDLLGLIQIHGFKQLAKCEYGDQTFLFQSTKL